ncbi:hypothetical protein SteCoe_12567 [Stentor coeruleus]|uniref:RING-type domain-containing protein n=1 Tax=Stentor coeruleus TaxID=5963 RepID=A0A1R2CAH1_9CILI|nr:hypothetical protein SteCoe_12567 [Stentor coeruleus]
MDCIICFGIYEDPRILDCGHSFCYKCTVSMISNNTIECPICRSVFHVLPNKLKKNFQLLGLIEEITTKNKSSVINTVKNQSNTQNMQNFNNSSSGINQNIRRNSLANESFEELASVHVSHDRNIDYHRKFYMITKPSTSSFKHALVFLFLFLPFDIAGLIYIDKNNNDCSEIRKWLIVWIASNFAFIIVAIFNTGFIIEDWQDLTLFEKILKVLVYCLGGFMFSWVWVGVSKVFTNSECEKDSQGIWAVSMAVLIMWIIVTGLLVIAMAFIFLYKLGVLQCLLDFKFPKLKKSLYMLIMFLLLFFPFDVVGIYYLNTTDEDCKNIRQWLIIWTVFCFALLVNLILNTGFLLRSWSKLTYAEVFLRVSLILIILFMFTWLLVGSSIVFHDTECKSYSYKLWSISMAITIFWICLIFLVLLLILFTLLYDYGFFDDFYFRFNWTFICTLTAFHLISFDVQSFIGIAFLNHENDCPSNILYHRLRNWLMAWIITSLFSLFLYNFTGISRGSSGFHYFIIILTGIIVAGQLTMVFVGAGYFFDSFGLSITDNCYSLWALVVSICSVWIILIFFTIVALVYLYFTS